MGAELLFTLIVVVISMVVLLTSSRPSSTGRKYPPAIGLSAIMRDLLLADKEKKSRPHCIFTRWAKTYGPVYCLRTGLSSGFVVLNSDKAAKEAMVEKHSSISGKKLTTALQVLSLDQTMVAVADYGRDHRFQKKLMVTYLLGSVPQKRNRFMREEMLHRIIDSMYSQLRIDQDSAGTQMNMSKIILDQLFPFALRQVLGRDADSVYVEEVGTIASIQQIYKHLVGEPSDGALKFNWREFIPYVSRLFPNKKLHRKLREMTRRRSGVVRALIQQHQEIRSRGKEVEGYLEMLLKEGKQLDEKQLETAIWEPILESSVTTRVVLEWALFELAKNSKCQDRLRDELVEICGDKIVTEDDLPKLPYLKAVFKETARKYPPLPLLPLRHVGEDVELAGYHIPAGWQILVNIDGINNYEGEWENPEIWKPERHLMVKEATNEEGADLQGTGMTFGAGKRLCPGWMQGMVIFLMIIGRIVQNFKWKLPRGYENSVEIIPNSGNQMMHPLWAIVTAKPNDHIK